MKHCWMEKLTFLKCLMKNLCLTPYFKHLENLEKIRRTNGPNLSSLPVDNKKSVTSSVEKSKNHKGSHMWCHYCDKNNHITSRLIAEHLPNLNSRKRTRFALKPKLDPERSLWPSFSFSKKLMHLKANWSLKRLQAVRRAQRKAESILSTEINVLTSPLVVMKMRIPSTCLLLLDPLALAKLS
jgi:hypothetical protein